TEMHLTRVLPELRRQGLDVSVFTLARGGQLEAQLVAKGVPVSGPADSGRRLVQSVRAGLFLWRELRRRRPDVIHFFLPEPYLVGSFASAGMRPMVRIMS